ncbi:hydantoinase/oxoprolinase family protein [Aurantimonas endophytica]|uniref:N-methylhydantoinase A n=1 Tax=Aurantimonas endophytica TaxID=1522175 RepID=A0A7W6MP46_9HYPH|nr:hydantoinase/oxoprolinase family protein [Aurantimonas endophytica]MBB4002610.1 N-methylhydantoinase A [Aurantimonas endophytica]MCO6403491.1 hydantoinase/oxoprolinase family protein [Aurantimonas endophytica]
MIEIGVDIGGTFTDVVCRAPDQPLRVMKVPTTRADPSRAVLEAVRQLNEQWNVAPEDVARFVHGTTVATNAVLERKGPKTGLLTTAGFKDILEIGRQMRQTMYAAVLEPEVPAYLAPGALRFEIGERVAFDGEIVRPLDEQDVLDAAAALVAAGVEGIAICFLFSFVNPMHERRAAEIIREAYPDIALSLSCEVDPAFREYERTVVTTFDAYIKPVIDRYLANLERGLEQAGVPAPLQIMQSRGGIATSEVARQRPVRLFLSGPAAGVVGARMVGQSAGITNLISVDIGGTSSDIALIRAGEPLIRPEGHVAGYNIRVPMVDVNAIGSGGGSIAWLDPAGGLRVGPHSAGSEPGPACYDRGGENATVTDASIVLGYLDPDYFAGGTVKLRPELSHKVIEEKVARPLGLSVEEAALGIHRVVNTQMTEGIRLVSIRQGYDPRDFALLPLGGAGGIHAVPLADELGITRILIARHPGVLSATGLLSAVVEHEMSAAFPRRVDELSLPEMRASLEELDHRCGELMEKERVRSEDVEISYFADVCFVGQSHYLEVPFVPGEDTAAELRNGFRAAHRRIFGHAADTPTQVVNLRAIHRAGGETISDEASAPATGENACKGTRQIVVPGYEGKFEAAIYDRERLAPGVTLVGPAVLEQADTTTVVPIGWSIRVIEGGNVLLSRDRAKG